jgi:hypothetical protein
MQVPRKKHSNRATLRHAATKHEAGRAAEPQYPDAAQSRLLRVDASRRVSSYIAGDLWALVVRVREDYWRDIAS